MSIIDQLSNDFSHQVRSRGRHYFQSKAVRITDYDKKALHATVQGSELYDVDIEWDDQGIEYSCTCPYFSENDAPCKHLFATLLAAEDRNLLPKQIMVVDREDADEDSEDDWDEENGVPVIQIGSDVRTMQPRGQYPRQIPQQNAPRRHAIWRRKLGDLRNALDHNVVEPTEPWPANKQIVYIVDGEETRAGRGLALDLAFRTANKSAQGWDRPRHLRMGRRQVSTLPDPVDRQIIQMLAGIGRSDYSSYYGSGDEIPRRYYLTDTSQDELLATICNTGRCRLRVSPAETDPRTISWDAGAAWDLILRVVPTEDQKGYRLAAHLRRGEEIIGIEEPSLLVAGGLVFNKNTVARLNDGGAFPFIAQLRHDQEIVVPIEQGDDLLEELMTMPRLPKLDLPESLKIAEASPTPRPRLILHAPQRKSSDNRLTGELSFQYDDYSVPFDQPNSMVFQRDQRRALHRDLSLERGAAAMLRDLSFRVEYDYALSATVFRLNPKFLPKAVRTLIDAKWRVEVDGKIYRQPGQIKIEVSSGIDWFELHGSADFGDFEIPLPKLLRALSKGETTIVLDDGTVGLLPEEWLKQYGLLGALGTEEGDTIQFAKNQVGLLDALLAAQPMIQVDESFAKARQQLLQFEGVTSCEPPETFTGSLRPYQKDGLGWLNFLRKFGLNGCLADDMGLGKTVQVLALLDDRRRLRQTPGEFADKPAGPSLVVVPRSLIYNWVQEATRFAPQLKVLDHATVDRLKTAEHFSDYDVILTTYGTLRNDALVLKDVRFDYAILDEAQAIKNGASETAKAARLLRADNRLALSGTPVQNHLGELWSLFEFLNPGMLGASRAFNVNGSGRALDDDSRVLLARALKPFILRRTKEQVARDLPEKVEQTIFCELDKNQRALYDELREHYRQSLLTRIATEGINKSKIQVLEALLRLRQVACHPGLLDKSRINEGSAKLDTLLPQLTEVAGEGHKALVFSQFTSLLAIVRKKLDEEGTVYEYLDGKTRDRQERVTRFQTDDNCKIFLISLKAGGVGLNLTAAQYVFLLDPWWNPAVEAQAIDRAHRIGQLKNVFAYRLIAKGTVEEKVLQLQQTKKDLADAIIKADNNLIAKLGKEDLELLLS